jgi:hypothetical protein
MQSHAGRRGSCIEHLYVHRGCREEFAPEIDTQSCYKTTVEQGRGRTICFDSRLVLQIPSSFNPNQRSVESTPNTGCRIDGVDLSNKVKAADTCFSSGLTLLYKKVIFGKHLPDGTG